MSQMFHYPLRVAPALAVGNIAIADSNTSVVAVFNFDPTSEEDLALVEKVRRLIESERTGTMRMKP